MLTKLPLFMVIAFAVGMCETPEYQRADLVGTYRYDGQDYAIYRAPYTTESSDGFAYFLSDPATGSKLATKSVAICLDTSLEECRTKFGNQLRIAANAERDEGGMDY